MSAQIVTLREAKVLGLLAQGNSWTTAVDAVGMSLGEAAGLRRRVRLSLDERDRLRKPEQVVGALIAALVAVTGDRAFVARDVDDEAEADRMRSAWIDHAFDRPVPAGPAVSAAARAWALALGIPGVGGRGHVHARIRAAYAALHPIGGIQ